jgi:peroxiredoxin
MLSMAHRAHLGLTSVGLVLFLSIGTLAFRSAQRQLGVQPTAADLALSDSDGRPVNLASLRGRIAALVFAADDSPACAAYDQRLADFADRYAESGTVQVLMVETGEASHGVKSNRPHRSLLGRRCKTLIDADGALAGRYGVRQLPTVVVVDEDGQLRYRGDFDDNRNPALVRSQYCREAIDKMLAPRAASAKFTQASALKTPK